jgi:hypothetical protein
MPPRKLPLDQIYDKAIILLPGEWGINRYLVKSKIHVP